MLDFDSVINRLKEKLDIKSDKEMYVKMDTNQGKYSMWKKRNKIPYEEITTLCCEKKLDINYILLGQKTENMLKNINFKEENHKLIEESNEKTNKIFYYLLNAEKARLEE